MSQILLQIKSKEERSLEVFHSSHSNPFVDRDKQRAVITENCDSESRPQKIKIKIKTFSKPCDTPQLTPTRLDSVTAQKRQAAPLQLLVPECATTQESASWEEPAARPILAANCPWGFMAMDHPQVPDTHSVVPAPHYRAPTAPILTPKNTFLRLPWGQQKANNSK